MNQNATDNTTAAEHVSSAAPLATVTQEQIERWKAAHREVLEIRVQVGPDDVAVGYLKPADRNIIAFALTRVMNKQLLEAGEFLLMNCWLGGDTRMKDGSSDADERVIVAAAIEAAGTIDLLSASSKKL